MQNLKDQSDLEKVIGLSEIKPVFLFKHSNTCPISARAHQQVVLAIESGEITLPVFILIVQDARELSDSVANYFQIKHESPQIILINKKEAVWHASHHNINLDSLKDSITTLNFK